MTHTPQEQLIDIARAVREEMIIPYCDKHNLKFTNTNAGDWKFYSDRGMPVDPFKIHTNIVKALECNPFGLCDKIGKHVKPYQPKGFAPTF